MYRNGYWLVAAGAALWGTIGIFVTTLQQLGFTSLQIAALRTGTAGLIMLCYCLWASPLCLRIKWRHLPFFLGTGILSIAFFNWCYFQAIQETSLSVAAVLLYTGPAFVVVLSRLFLKEPLTRLKLLSLVATLLGCSLVVGWLPAWNQNISWTGLLIGLGSGLGYGLYSIIGKPASSHYSSLTITTYTFIIAAVFLVPMAHFGDVQLLLADRTAWLYVLGLAVFPTVIAYQLYTTGLSKMESGRASITATIEPVIAVLIGTILLGDILSPWQIGGMVSILAGVILIRLEPERSPADGN